MHIVDMWEVRKLKLDSDDSCPSQLQSQSLAGDLTGVEGQRAGMLNQNGKLQVGHSCTRVIKGKLCEPNCVMYLDVNVCGSAHGRGCVVNGSDAMAAD